MQENMICSGLWELENRLYAQGKQGVCGVDEAGAGPLAGAVYAAAVILPPGLTLRAGKLARAVRDADKLDILPILIGYLKDPENKSIVFGLDSTPELSPVVRDTMLRGECPRHRDMRTVCDFVSCKLLWAHDLNFNWSRDEFRKRGYLESIRSFLPDTPLIRQIYDNARNALQPQP